jgi:hypothetical protein
MVQDRGRIGGLGTLISSDKIEVRRGKQAQASQIERAVKPPTVQK